MTENHKTVSEKIEYGEKSMSKAEAVMYYNSALALFRQWLNEEAITEDDYYQIEEIMAEKYGLHPNSIYRHTRELDQYKWTYKTKST